MDIEVIMEAQFIPLGATVGVATGSRRYTLQSCIRFTQIREPLLY
jgi:hypothetical protein